MTSGDVLRGIFALLFAGVISYAVYTRNDEKEPIFGKPKRYSQLIPPYLLPMFLICLLIAGLFFLGRERTVNALLAICFPIFLHIGIYCAILLLFLPLLRKRILAGTCALLWLLPNYLYLAGQSFMRPSAPRFVLRLKPETVRIILIVWAAGFVGIMLWKIISHLHFRRKLLKGARAETDEVILLRWSDAQLRIGLNKPRYRLMRANGVASPLSVGLFGWTLRVVLPEAEYSFDELDLIFRHELIHIQRSDCWTKFFLVFCTAMNWFNPLMWIAMRRSAEDIELSCDESVLENANDAERRCYADLILRSVGSGRGFTTCLSAAASSLRYRLKSIMQPKECFTGAILVGVLFFLMVITCGYTALASGGKTAGEVLLAPCGITEESTPEFFTRSQGARYTSCTCTDEKALIDYLSGLQVYTLTGAYSWDAEEGNSLCLMFGSKSLYLKDHNMHITDLTQTYRNTSLTFSDNYYIHEEIDWDFIDSLLAKIEYVPPRSDPPSLVLDFGENGPQTDDYLYAETKLLSKSVNGEAQSIAPLPEPDAPCTVSGTDIDVVDFGFPVMPVEFSVRVDAFDGSETYFESGDVIEGNDYRLSLAPYSAHYTVNASFFVDTGETETEYEMQFCFDVIRP